MTDAEKERIDGLSHADLARIWRFSPLGCFPFKGAAWDYYVRRFEEKGGMTTEISKEIGWDKPGEFYYD